MKIEKIKISSPFKDLFPVDPKILNAVRDHMRTFGYDKSQPVVIWKGRDIVIDGHTRFRSASDLGIKEIPAHEMGFEDEDEALTYAIHNQRDRRNLTDADFMRLVPELDKRKIAGRPSNEKLRLDNLNLGPSRKQTAEILGTSETKVQKARAILDHGSEELKERVKGGRTSLNRAYGEIREEEKQRPRAKAMFNETNENIEWAKWSWNPVVGCKHGCPYCYARDIANRFYGDFEPKFFEERLEAPINMGNPKSDEMRDKTVFVCSMADLFGRWVPREWIERVIEQVRKCEKWNFLFLTKNPKRYVEFEFPANAWLGTTVDCQKRVRPTLDAFEQIKNDNIKFISFEPLLEEVFFDEEINERDMKVGPISELSMFDWIIIGGKSQSTGESASQPKWEWWHSLLDQAIDAGCKVYFKPNLTSRPKEYPGMGD